MYKVTPSPRPACRWIDAMNVDLGRSTVSWIGNPVEKSSCGAPSRIVAFQLRRDFRESTEDNDNYKHMYYLTTYTGG